MRLIPTLILLLGACTPGAGMDGGAADMSSPDMISTDQGADSCHVTCMGVPPGCTVVSPGDACHCGTYTCPDAGDDSGAMDAEVDTDACVAPKECRTDAECGCAAPCVITTPEFPGTCAGDDGG